MALTDEQKASLESLKESIEEWRSEQQALIDKEFNFLNSINLSDSALSELVISDLVTEVIADIESLQLTGEAYEDGS